MSMHASAASRYPLALVLPVLLALGGAAHAQCVAPPAEMGDIIFNRQHKVLQYCNGDAWIGLWGGGGGDVSAGLPDCPAGAALVSNGQGWICGLPDQVPPVWQTASALPTAHVGKPYSHTVVATDNNGSVFYSGGTSNWINFDAQSGELSGTPDIPGTFTLNLTARDGAGNFATRSFSIPVIAAPCSQSLIIGCTAPDGAVYAGNTVGGSQMYVAAADEGSFMWGGDCKNDSTADHDTDGLANTNILVADGHGHPAAEACRARGPDWYLPAIQELFILDQNRSNLVAANLPSSGTYWSSTEFLSYTSFCTSTGPGRGTTWRPPAQTKGYEDKDRSYSVRCVRR